MEQDQARLRRLALYPLAVALSLRLLWGMLIPTIPLSDSHAYDIFAQNIAQGGSYGWKPDQPSAYWPVGTSAIYALFFRLIGHNYMPLVLFQVAIGVAVVALSMSLALRWFNGKVALTTGWLLACWPVLIEYTTLLASELIFMFFVLLAFWLASLPARHWLARALLSGVSLAAASYVRPLALIMAPLLFMREAVKKREWFVPLLACTVATVTMLVSILPWSLRNWQVFERVVLISTNGGSNLWMGNNPGGGIGYVAPPKVDIANEADRDKYFARQAKEYIAQDPAAFLLRSVKKLISLHDRETIGVTWNEEGIKQRLGQSMLPPLKLASTVYWWVVLTAAFCGIVALARNTSLLLLLTCPPVATWAYFSLVHCVTVAGDRYHIPSVPFIAMLAGYCLSRFLDLKHILRTETKR